MTGCAVFHASLCLLEPASETASALLGTSPASSLELALKELRQSGIDWRFQDLWSPKVGQLAFVCQEFGPPESAHRQEPSDFLSALVSGHRNRKAGFEPHCRKPCFALSEGCLGGSPGNMKLALYVYLNPISLQF